MRNLRESIEGLPPSLFEKFSADEVISMFKEYAGGVNCMKIARKYGVPSTVVLAILTRKKRREVEVPMELRRQVNLVLWSWRGAA
jgi:hypothetical protein